MKQTYLYILWKNNKKLAVAIIGFCCFQAFFTYKQVETTPFFNYGMYSAPIPAHATYSTVSVYQNSKKISLFEQQKSPAFLQYQLSYYSRLLQQDSIDYTRNTIESRFGTNSSISRYLNNNINTYSAALQEFPSVFEKWVFKEIEIHQENYEWVNYNFKKVSQKQLH